MQNDLHTRTAALITGASIPIFAKVWELLKPVVPEFRERFADKNLLVNLEKAAQFLKLGPNAARRATLRRSDSSCN